MVVDNEDQKELKAILLKSLSELSEESLFIKADKAGVDPTHAEDNIRLFFIDAFSIALEKKTVKELRNIANDNGLKGYSKLRKFELQCLIAEHVNDDGIFDSLLLSIESNSLIKPSSKTNGSDKIKMVLQVLGLLLAIPTVIFASINFFSINPQNMRATATAESVSTNEAIVNATSTAQYLAPTYNGFLAISETPNLDPNIDEFNVLDNIPYKVSNVPSSLLEQFGDSENVFYLWYFIINRNDNKQSCSKEIEISGPLFNFEGSTGTSFTLNSSYKAIQDLNLETLFPNASIRKLSGSNNIIKIGDIGEMLLANQPLQGPIFLILNNENLNLDFISCGGDVLAIPIGAFHYVPTDNIPAINYVLDQLSLKDVTFIFKAKDTVAVGVFNDEAVEHLLVNPPIYLPIVIDPP